MATKREQDTTHVITFQKNELLPLIEAELRRSEPAKGLPGFRPGKAPLQKLYSANGHQAVQRAVQNLLSLRTLYDGNADDLFETPSFAIDWSMVPDTLDAINTLDVTVTVIVMPAIPETDWGSIEMASYAPKISDSDVKKELDKKAKKSLVPVPLKKERPAEKGDFLSYSITYTDHDGNEVTSRNTLLLGSDEFKQRFGQAADELVGILPGHTIKEKIRFPKTYPMKELAGLKKSITIVFDAIQDSGPAKADDDFAKSAGFDNLDAMKESIKKELADYGATLCEIAERKELRNALSTILTFDPPAPLVERIAERLRQGAKSRKEDIKDADIQKQALSRARFECFVTKMTKTHDITVQDNELKGYAEHMARQTGHTIDTIATFWRNNPDQVDIIVQEILERKCLDMGRTLAKKTKHEKSIDELMALLDGGNAQ
jgi:trigger factor